MSMFTWRDVPDDIHCKWKSVAALRGVTMSALLEQALQAYLDQLDVKMSDRPNLGPNNTLDDEWDLDQDKLDAFNDPQED